LSRKSSAKDQDAGSGETRRGGGIGAGIGMGRPLTGWLHVVVFPLTGSAVGDRTRPVPLAGKKARRAGVHGTVGAPGAAVGNSVGTTCAVLRSTGLYSTVGQSSVFCKVLPAVQRWCWYSTVL